jgi:hypothetical protein
MADEIQLDAEGLATAADALDEMLPEGIAELDVAEIVLQSYLTITQREPEFPLESYREAAPHMRRPFTAAAIKHKVQASFPKDNPTTALIVCYIDARLVIERLNLLVPHLWNDPIYESVGGGKGLLCKLTVDGITRQDVGEGVGKALYSDAFKRAAVKFGIGVMCYAVPKILVQGEERVEQRSSGQKKALVLKGPGETFVRERYQKWLDETGSKAFGEPLDHGDVAESQGDYEGEAAAEAGATTEGAPALDDEQARAQRTEAERLFGELHQIDPKAMLRNTFDNYLISAQHSHDKLDDFLGYLRGRVDDAKKAGAKTTRRRSSS